jgi:hypothetical protein
MRLHLLGALDGTIRSVILASADQKERDVARRLFALGLRGGEAIVCDKGYAGAEFAGAVATTYGAAILRPARKTEPANTAYTSPRSANASNRSSGPSKTNSVSKHTGRAR